MLFSFSFFIISFYYFFFHFLPSFPTPPLLDKSSCIQDWYQGHCIEDFIKLHLFIHSYAMPPEDNLQEPPFSFHYVGPKLRTRVSILSHCTILVTQPWTSILPTLRHKRWKSSLPPCPVVGCWDLYPGLCGC